MSKQQPTDGTFGEGFVAGIVSTIVAIWVAFFAIPMGYNWVADDIASRVKVPPAQPISILMTAPDQQLYESDGSTLSTDQSTTVSTVR